MRVSVYAARFVIGGATPDSRHSTEIVPASTFASAAGEVNCTSARTVGSRINEEERKARRVLGSANSCMINE